MKLGEFGRDMSAAPSSEDRIVALVGGEEVEIEAVEFRDGKVVLLPAANPGAAPVALAEQTAQDQAAFSEDGSVPGHADVMSQVATGEGIASDVRAGDVKTEPDKSGAWSDRGQEYHTGPEQPQSAPVVDESAVTEDSGT